MVQCPTNFGRRNRYRQPLDQVEYFKAHGMLVEKVRRMQEEGREIPPDTIVLGELARRNRPAMGVKP